MSVVALFQLVITLLSQIFSLRVAEALRVASDTLHQHYQTWYLKISGTPCSWSLGPSEPLACELIVSIPTPAFHSSVEPLEDGDWFN